MYLNIYDKHLNHLYYEYVINTWIKGKATHSSILAWRSPWTVHGVAKSQTWLSNFHFTLTDEETEAQGVKPLKLLVLLTDRQLEPMSP